MNARLAEVLANNPAAILSQAELHEQIVREQQKEINLQRAAKNMAEMKLAAKTEECAQLRMAFIRLEADQRRHLDVMGEKHAADLRAMGEGRSAQKLADLDFDLMHTVAIGTDGKPHTLYALWEDGYTSQAFTRWICECLEPECYGCKD